MISDFRSDAAAECEQLSRAGRAASNPVAIISWRVTNRLIYYSFKRNG